MITSRTATPVPANRLRSPRSCTTHPAADSCRSMIARARCSAASRTSPDASMTADRLATPRAAAVGFERTTAAGQPAGRPCVRAGSVGGMTHTTATTHAHALRHPGGELDLPLVEATTGNDGIDVSSLLTTPGLVTVDPGFVNTASCSSEVTYIDGDAGILQYRGYPIEQLAEKSSFLEVCYLLIYGELPTASELEDFEGRIRRHTMLHEDLKRFFDGFPRDAHPMPVLSSAVSALSTFYQDSLNPFDPEQVEISTVRLLAKLPTIAAYAYKKSVGQPFLYPDNSHGLVENFLRMTFGFPAEPYEVDPATVKALDLLFVLHADHEQNCSTSTVRLVGSAQANLFASISAGIHALSG